MKNTITYDPDAPKLDHGMMKQVIEGLGASSGLNVKNTSIVEECRKLPIEELKKLVPGLLN